VVEVRASRWIAIRETLFGALVLLIGVCAFIAGWVKNTHTGPGVVTWPLLGVSVGGMFIFGALRNRIVVSAADAKYSWLSPPLSYRRTLSICQEAADKARASQIYLVSSHA